MSLEAQLKARRVAAEASREQSQVDIMLGTTERLIREGIDKHALKVGDQIPNASLPNAQGHPVNIADLLASGPVIINFYRGSWCPYCNLELRAYQQYLDEIKASGGQIVAISPELPDSSLSNAEKLELEFEVLSDLGNSFAEQLGLVFTIPDELAEVYKQLNSDITPYTGDNSWRVPIPATYIIGTDHKVAYAYVNADYLERAEPAEVVAALAQLVDNQN